MSVQISIAKGTSNPTSSTGLTLGEPAFNYSNNTLWMGKGSGVSPVWVGAGVCGASGGIAAGLTTQLPTHAAVKNYFDAVSSSFLGATASRVTFLNGISGGITLNAGTNITITSSAAGGITIDSSGGGGAVSSVSGSGNGISVSPTTGAVIVSNTGVHSFNGATGAVTGVCAAVAGSYITVSAATGSVTITNTGVQTFNGLTGTIQGVSSWNGQTGAVSFVNYVASFNGSTGAVQGVSSASAGTGISISAATGAITITNTGVQTFNGATGAVTGASLGANTFTALNSFNAGISSAGGTFSSLARFTAGLTASSVYGGTVYTNNIVAQDVGSPVYINDSGAEKITYIGDYSGAGSSTLLTVDDSTNTITLGGQVTATSGIGAASISSAGTIYFGTGLARNDSVSTPLTTTASNQIIWNLLLGDTTEFPFSASFRSAEFMIQATKGTTFEAMKMLVINDDTNTWNTQYGVIRNGATMGSYNTTIVTVGSDKYLRLRVTPTYTSTTFKVAGTFLPS